MTHDPPGERANLPGRDVVHPASCPGSFSRLNGTLHIARASRFGRIQEIQIKVCAKYGIGIEEMLGERRHKHLVRARWEAINQAYYETGFSTTVLGRSFNRDHTTILYALGRVRRNGKPRLIPAAGEKP